MFLNMFSSSVLTSFSFLLQFLLQWRRQTATDCDRQTRLSNQCCPHEVRLRERSLAKRTASCGSKGRGVLPPENSTSVPAVPLWSRVPQLLWATAEHVRRLHRSCNKEQGLVELIFATQNVETSSWSSVVCQPSWSYSHYARQENRFLLFLTDVLQPPILQEAIRHVGMEDFTFFTRRKSGFPHEEISC